MDQHPLKIMSILFFDNLLSSSASAEQEAASVV